MSALEVDRTGTIPVVRHSSRNVLMAFMAHLKSEGYLKFSYPMPDQEKGEGWLMFLYEPIEDELVVAFEA